MQSAISRIYIVVSHDLHVLFDIINKVITTMVIVPLDDYTYCARSASTRLGALAKDVRLFIASLHSQLMYPKMCSVNIVVNLQPVG